MEKKMKKEDRISHLPDCLIHHILSFFPSTKQAIQTSVLSKRWRNQWTHVPVIIFNGNGMSDENFFNFIDRALTLHKCSQINKLHIEYDNQSNIDPNFNKIISFVTAKNVEDLILNCHCSRGRYVLPEHFFNYAHLVKLQASNCNFIPNITSVVNWKNLKELNLCSSELSNQVITSILCGSPILESLELHGCSIFAGIIMASKQSKRLAFLQSDSRVFFCPNLEELDVKSSRHRHYCLSSENENVFWELLYKSIEFDEPVVTVKLLRRLVLDEPVISFHLKAIKVPVTEFRALDN